MDKGSLLIMESYLSGIATAIGGLPLDKIAAVVELLDEASLKGSKVFTFGNGGSAATASHFACDLAKGTICEDKPRLKVFALADNTPLFSAWANDTDYSNVFAEQMYGLVEPGDIAIAISGSGNSPNVLNGTRVARIKGATTVGFIGFDGGKLKDLVDIPLIVANNNMEQVEDIHLMLAHLITVCLRQKRLDTLMVATGMDTMLRQV